MQGEGKSSTPFAYRVVKLLEMRKCGQGEGDKAEQLKESGNGMDGGDREPEQDNVWGDKEMAKGNGLEKNIYLSDLAKFYENSSLSYDYHTSSESADVEPCNLQQTMAFDQRFLPALYSFISLLGILGNVLVVVVLMKNKWKLQSTDIFILHLALADIMLVITLPFWAVQTVSGWIFGDVLCKIVASVFKINLYASTFLLVCISCDRYLSIVHALQIYKKHRLHMVHWSCLLVWCLCIGLSIPDMIYFQVNYEYRTEMTECLQVFDFSSSKTWRISMAFLYHVLGFLLPLCFMVYCYLHICLTLKGSQGFKKQRALRVIIAVVVAFFLCWAPYNIAALMGTLKVLKVLADNCKLESDIDIALSVTSGLCYFHSCLNPILYAFIGAKFKKQFLELLSKISCICPQIVKKYTKHQPSKRSSSWSESADTSISGIIVKPLMDLTHKRSKASEWSDDAEEAFQALKAAFAPALVQSHPKTDLPYTLEVDASDTVSYLPGSKDVRADALSRQHGLELESDVQPVPIIPQDRILATLRISITSSLGQEILATQAESPPEKSWGLPYIPPDSAPCKFEPTIKFNQLFIPIAFWIVFVLDLLGNGLVLHVLRSRRCPWHIADHYLFHLALSDLLLGLTLPFWAIQYSYGWIFGRFSCKILGALFTINMYSSIYFLASISLNRYFAIVHAVELHRKQRPIHTFLICFFVWCISFLLSWQEFQFREVEYIKRFKTFTCYYNFNPEKSNVWRIVLRLINLNLGFLIPMFLMIFFYCRIFCTLQQSRLGHSRRSQVVIVVLLLVFVFCWAPYNGLLLFDSLQRLEIIGQDCNVYNKLDMALTITESLGIAHVCLNPFVYAFVGVKFRKELSGLFKRGSEIIHSGVMSSKENTINTENINSYSRVL
ncbi:uncharacterized protein WCC33_011620 [Rhinophrynus dorsalis]